VVVDQVDITGITILETECDTPIPRNAHAPVTSSVTPEPVKAIPWQIEIIGCSRTIQMSEDVPHTTQLVGPDLPAVALLVEALEALVAKALNHEKSYRVSERGPIWSLSKGIRPADIPGRINRQNYADQVVGQYGSIRRLHRWRMIRRTCD